ncbi:Unknown protein sequence [Pseudomonas syringae pv. cilantro]|uniref:Uncharacterized protein n=1 Tax=Pseudomonas syringae pv. cilantro TaxID=81035 RepID=A0A0N1JP96_PSESX|nr:Unknown protein sequence [Pseudomonas syringae pv. cilantro]
MAGACSQAATGDGLTACGQAQVTEWPLNAASITPSEEILSNKLSQI